MNKQALYQKHFTRGFMSEMSKIADLDMDDEGMDDESDVIADSIAERMLNPAIQQDSNAIYDPMNSLEPGEDYWYR